MKTPQLPILTVLIFLTFPTASAQKVDVYTKLWNTVYRHELNGLPQSASNVADSIYQIAKRERNQNQIAKSLLYQSKFALTLQEDAVLAIVAKFKREINYSRPPVTNVLESFLANIYWQYFKVNRWRFYDRSRISSQSNDEDFRTWDEAMLFRVIHEHYQRSLLNAAALRTTPLELIDPLLVHAENSRKYRPTLYDFLAHNAIEFYSTDDNPSTAPLNEFKPSDERYYLDFENMPIERGDAFSPLAHALILYQELLSFHRMSGDTAAYVNLQTERIALLAEHEGSDRANILRKKALGQLIDDYQSHSASALATYELASLLYQEGTNQIDNAPDSVQFLAEALSLCDHALSRFAESDGGKRCQVLKTRILERKLSLVVEEHLPVLKPSLISVTYTNVDTLHFKIYPATDDIIQQIRSGVRNDSANWSAITSLTPQEEWSVRLKNLNDYRSHNTEIPLPELRHGKYIIFASTDDTKIYRQQIFAHALIQITDIALIEYSSGDRHHYRAVDRNNGAPLVGANIHLKVHHPGQEPVKLDTLLTTGKDGEVTLNKGADFRGSLTATVRYGNEAASFGDYYVYQTPTKKRQEKRTHAAAFLYTDRSIYRPGQTVYFKCILIKTTDKKSSVVPGQYLTITLDDVNGSEVGSLRLKTNAFGSVSGEFRLPTTGLTGEYTLSADEDDEGDSKFYDNLDDFAYAEHPISVEEYKRPTFEVIFKPVAQTFALYDTVNITGQAESYSGAPIAAAKVTYRVTRQVQYPRWHFWRPGDYTSDGAEIGHGETITNEKGEYALTFPALPAEKVSPSTKPVFVFEITTDITDISGETRSATTTVRVGYHTVVATLSAAGQIDRWTPEHEIAIRTENLNGEFVPLKGVIEIHKLQSPRAPLRARPWPAPDLPLLTEAEFHQRFPHESYSGSTDPKTWRDEQRFIEIPFDTRLSKVVRYRTTPDWPMGHYRMVLTATDSSGRVINDYAYFTLDDNRSNKVADNALIVFETDKPTYNVGDIVRLRVGSAAPDVTLYIDVEKDQSRSRRYIRKFSGNTRTFMLPVTSVDENGFSVTCTGVVYNSFISQTINIPVTFSPTQLEIETGTFKDKLLTGTKETWSFSIKGPDGARAEAEVLASMYDASLDQFKSHRWSFQPFNNVPYFARVHFNGRQSFGNTHFEVRNIGYWTPVGQHQYYDQFDWFGFSFSQSSYVQRAYLDRLYSSGVPLGKPSKVVSGNTKNAAPNLVFGRIVDNDGQPLPGVNVIIKGTTTGTTSDAEGRYTIGANKNDVIVYSFIGYATVEARVGRRNTLDVFMEPDITQLSEVVVTAYGVQTKKQAMASMAYTVDFGESSDVQLVKVMEGAVPGVQKSEQRTTDEELAKVNARQNFKETAFFLPHLSTNENGNIRFTFTTPESLTRWKLQLLAHTKDLLTTTKTLQAITQKELMITPNFPRFLRTGDEIVLSVKISNLSDKKLNGNAALELTDAISGKNVDVAFANNPRTKAFTMGARSNAEVSWRLKVPDGIGALQYKLVAKAGTFSDGEQNVLPVLSNRTLVTETLPFYAWPGESKTFHLPKLHSPSPTARNHRLTVEVTSNPAWYAVQSLPYLMEFPHECAEQLYARYYANALATHIVETNPKIREMFREWGSREELTSNLEKNAELKSTLIEESPWLRDAVSESEQKKRVSLLFDTNNTKGQMTAVLNKLGGMQFSNGGFPWFAGARDPNRYITQHIAATYGHLKKLGVQDLGEERAMITRAVLYLDNEATKEYEETLSEARRLSEKTKNSNDRRRILEEHLSKHHPSDQAVHYLYARSFFDDLPKSELLTEAVAYYQRQSAAYWQDFNLYTKAMVAIVHHRKGDKAVAQKIMRSLVESAIKSDELGMYWKENTGGMYWHEAPIETQALLIEAFTEISTDNTTRDVDELRLWLLKHKQTTQWKSTRATTEAVYALLLHGSDWLSDGKVDVTVGGTVVTPGPTQKAEAGTGYFKTFWEGEEITLEMATVKFSPKGKSPAWGGLYWQYFEDLDKITPAQTPLQLSRNIFVVTNTDQGELLTDIKFAKLKPGDRLRVRIELKADRPMEFLHMKDMRAAGLEPVDVLSGYRWQESLGYYQSTRDASTNFFFDYVPKGVYVFEYDLRVNNRGNFSNGIATIQSMYAPEFSSHSAGTTMATDP